MNDKREISRLKQALQPDPVDVQLRRDFDLYGLSIARRRADGKRERVDPSKVVISNLPHPAKVPTYGKPLSEDVYAWIREAFEKAGMPSKDNPIPIKFIDSEGRTTHVAQCTSITVGSAIEMEGDVSVEPIEIEEHPPLEATIAVADQPDASGNVHTREALEECARKTPGLRFEDGRLIAHIGSGTIVKDDREPIRPTDIEPKPAPAVTARRAIRIDVDSCADCPFYRPDVGVIGQKEPARCASDGHGDGRERAFTDEENGTYEPPEWCPITGMVVLIGGPRAER